MSATMTPPGDKHGFTLQALLSLNQYRIGVKWSGQAIRRCHARLDFMPKVGTDQIHNGPRSLLSTQDVLDELRRLVDSDDYRYGDKLPAERELADRYQVSRRALKNAFAILEAEGKVWRGVGQGTFVGRRAPEPFADLAGLARTSNPIAVLEARLSFEPAVARFAGERASSSDIQELQECLGRGIAAKDSDEFMRWDERFHELLVVSAQNPLFDAIYGVINGVWSRLSWGSRLERAHTQEWKRIYLRQHRSILEAIEGRDLDRAEILVLEHWQTMRSNLVGNLVRDHPRGV